MAEKLLFELVSPERMLMSREVDQVTVPGTEGEFGVLPRHAPLMSSLGPGVIRVDDEGGTEQIFVRAGFAQVTPQGLTVLAEHATPLSELDVAQVDQQIRDLEEDVADAKDDDTRMKAQLSLEQLKQVRAILAG